MFTILRVASKSASFEEKDAKLLKAKKPLTKRRNTAFDVRIIGEKGGGDCGRGIKEGRLEVVGVEVVGVVFSLGRGWERFLGV